MDFLHECKQLLYIRHYHSLAGPRVELHYHDPRMPPMTQFRPFDRSPVAIRANFKVPAIQIYEPRPYRKFLNTIKLLQSPSEQPEPPYIYLCCSARPDDINSPAPLLRKMLLASLKIDSCHFLFLKGDGIRFDCRRDTGYSRR